MPTTAAPALPATAATWMRRALALARNAWGNTHPNPLVGALIIEDNAIAAEGWHERAGEPHAEINALRALGRPPAPDATLVVTLEPCSTHGRTGACTTAILDAGIRRIIAGATDPFPAHAGRGFALLRDAGVEVHTGVLADDCADLNLIFNHRVTHGAPFVALKTAATLDGRIATSTGESRWITGPDARADVMQWRRNFPAIATSAATVLADNPRLTARLPDHPEWCPAARFIFDRRLRLAKKIGQGLHVLEDEFAARTILVTTEHAPAPATEKAATPAAEEAHAAALAALEKNGTTVWRLPAHSTEPPPNATAQIASAVLSVHGKSSPRDLQPAAAAEARAAHAHAAAHATASGPAAFFTAFKARCAAAAIDAIWVEGGGEFLGAWLHSGAADYLFHYTAPKLLADPTAIPSFAGPPLAALSQATHLLAPRHTLFPNGDILTRAHLPRPPAP
jgi:diaminohydroxyphosphoribosylaminopyrimidine deaminase/5-amino-6-(5-phosphoribosylamino)uracil reductase